MQMAVTGMEGERAGVDIPVTAVTAEDPLIHSRAQRRADELQRAGAGIDRRSGCSQQSAAGLRRFAAVNVPVIEVTTRFVCP